MPAAKPTFVVAELSSPLKIVLQLFSSEEGERRLSLAHIAAFLSHLLSCCLTLKATLKHGAELGAKAEEKNYRNCYPLRNFKHTGKRHIHLFLYYVLSSRIVG